MAAVPEYRGSTLYPGHAPPAPQVRTSGLPPRIPQLPLEPTPVSPAVSRNSALLLQENGVYTIREYWEKTVRLETAHTLKFKLKSQPWKETNRRRKYIKREELSHHSPVLKYPILATFNSTVIHLPRCYCDLNQAL